MQKQLDEAVEKFKNSQTSFDSYQAISDFVKIIIEVPEFIKQVETEGEKIRIAQMELNADKGWTYGLRGRELDKHNENRGKKWETLFQLDPLFPLSELETIHEWLQSENMTDTALLFQNCKPDDALPESERKRYQGFMDKLYKKILPFLKVEEMEEAQEEIKVKSYDEENKILIIGKYQIKIAKNEGNNNAHEIMSHIFIDHKDDLRDKFDYSDIAEQRLGADYDAEDKNAHQPYSGACKRINQIIKDETNSEVKDFLIYNHSKLGYVKINPIYL